MNKFVYMVVVTHILVAILASAVTYDLMQTDEEAVDVQGDINFDSYLGIAEFSVENRSMVVANGSWSAYTTITIKTTHEAKLETSGWAGRGFVIDMHDANGGKVDYMNMPANSTIEVVLTVYIMESYDRPGTIRFDLDYWDGYNSNREIAHMKVVVE